MSGLLWTGVRRVAPLAAAPTLVVLAAWLGGTGALAATGVLSRFDRLPPPGFFALLGFAAATVALACSPLGKRLALGLPMWALVGFQAFRWPLELVLHRLYGEGVLPVHMTTRGGITTS